MDIREDITITLIVFMILLIMFMFMILPIMSKLLTNMIYKR